MKRMILFVTAICFFLVLSTGVEAEKLRGLAPPSKQQPAPGNAQLQEPVPNKKTFFYFRRKMNSSDVSVNSTQESHNNDAQLIEGVINGTIVQRGIADLEQFKAQKYNAKYRLTDGANIKTINERGVYARGFTTIIEVGSNSPLDEMLILEYLNQFANENKGKQLEFRFDSLKDNSKCFVATAIFGEAVETNLDELPILGEFRQAQGKSHLIPALEVTTEKGLVKIPVNQLVYVKKLQEPPANKDGRQDKQLEQPTKPPTADQTKIGQNVAPEGELYFFHRKTNSTTPASSEAQVSQPAKGKLIEGEIKGIIVQKIETNKVSAAGYRLTKGQDIVQIDEEGVQVRGTSTIMIAANDDESKPINDLAFIQEAAQNGQLRFGTITKDGVSTTIAVKPVEYTEGVKTQEVILQERIPILGELRCDGGCQILPRLEIETIKGVVTIPVGKIVIFKLKNQ